LFLLSFFTSSPEFVDRFLPDGKDFEGTEHDGDVEDYSDNESTEPDQLEKLMYYPQNEEMSR
jgi:hypothetical protein